ncbi:hypothetical protein HPG69_008953 [Diceros bicornis minor]|uniref:Glutathione peroxidase n=1 Tax=Diceros bicornis minor TaxID=77932 RepID=A0A7J7EB39_DICBM|nr:hypothetical protein HPG69_008953 [Diceros bicornis minor]
MSCSGAVGPAAWSSRLPVQPVLASGERQERRDPEFPQARPTRRRVRGQLHALGEARVCHNDLAWNFKKFPVGPDGVPVRTYGCRFPTIDIEPDIEALLSQGPGCA